MTNDSIVIYHNPRCSKSRNTLAILEEAGVDVEVRRYLEEPPQPAEIERLLDLLELEPRELMRDGEAEYAELGLADPLLPAATLIEAIHEHPKLLQRPIVVRGDKAVIGRPPENVLALLD